MQQKVLEWKDILAMFMQGINNLSEAVVKFVNKSSAAKA